MRDVEAGSFEEHLGKILHEHNGNRNSHESKRNKSSKKMKKKVQDMHDAKTVSFEEHIGGILHGHYEGLERKAQEAHSKISSSNHATMRSSSDTEVINKRDELVAQSKR